MNLLPPADEGIITPPEWSNPPAPEECMHGRVDPCECGTEEANAIIALTPSAIVIDQEACPDCASWPDGEDECNVVMRLGGFCQWQGAFPRCQKYGAILPGGISGSVSATLFTDRGCACCTWVYSVGGDDCLLWEGRMVNTGATPCGVYERTGGCSATETVTITCSEVAECGLVIDAGPDEVDVSATITLTASGGTEPYTWASSNEDAATVDPETGEVSGVSGCCTVTITVTDAANCQASKEITVNFVAANYLASPIPILSDCSNPSGTEWDGQLVSTACNAAADSLGGAGGQTSGKNFLFAEIPTAGAFEGKLVFSCASEGLGQAFWVGDKASGCGLAGIYVINTDLSTGYTTPTVTLSLVP